MTISCFREARSSSATGVLEGDIHLGCNANFAENMTGEGNIATMRERDIQNQIQLALSKIGAVLFRNNVGLAWVGRVVDRAGGTVTLANARPLHAGLHVGSPDLFGWYPMKVTEEMLGRTIAVATGIEVKSGSGRITPDQINFGDRMSRAGGIWVMARSEDDATRAVFEFERGDDES